MNYVENILSVYSRATAAQMEAGVVWYENAHTLALDIANGDAWMGAGVLAALSPQKEWKQNITLARRAFSQGYATGHVGVFCAYADRIMAGEHPLEVMRGPKTRAFCAAIATPSESVTTTVDRHAHDIAMGRVFTDKERRISKGLYNTLDSAYRDVAIMVGVPVTPLQAITWVVWREDKGIA